MTPPLTGWLTMNTLPEFLVVELSPVAGGSLSIDAWLMGVSVFEDMF